MCTARASPVTADRLPVFTARQARCPVCRRSRLGVANGLYTRLARCLDCGQEWQEPTDADLFHDQVMDLGRAMRRATDAA